MDKVSVTDCKAESIDSMSGLLLTSNTFNSYTLIPSKECKPVLPMVMDSAEVIPEVKPVFSKAGKESNNKVPTVVNWAKLAVAKMVDLARVNLPETNCKSGALRTVALVPLMYKSP